MSVHTLDPTRDPRWADFVDQHPSATVFHTPAFLEAILRTYDYVPVAYTTSAPGAPLTNGIALCQIRSWLTGRRMVSVPFADHCEPLLDSEIDQEAIGGHLQEQAASKRWKYVELRPVTPALAHRHDVSKEPSCFLHTLDLRPGLDELLRQTHKTSIQQPIKRAEREGLIYEEGSSERLLSEFYALLAQTRRKHQLPPQPLMWFRNLIATMGPRLKIRVAFKESKAVASILTLEHRDTMVYKYGCSDAASQNLGGTPFLLWKTITEAKSRGFTSLDFGRSDADNEGLIAFKTRWGAKPVTLTYLRWSTAVPVQQRAGHSRGAQAVKQLFAIMPDPLLQAAGRLLYRHVG